MTNQYEKALETLDAIREYDSYGKAIDPWHIETIRTALNNAGKVDVLVKALEELIPPEYKFKDLGYDDGCPICAFNPDKIRVHIEEALAAWKGM